MNRDNLSNNKHEATLQLKFNKEELLALAALLTEGKLKTINQVSGEIWNRIEEIDEELGV